MEQDPTGVAEQPHGVRALFHEVPTWAWWTMAAGAIGIVVWKIHKGSSSATAITPIADTSSTTGVATSLGNTSGANSSTSTVQNPIDPNTTMLESMLQTSQAELAALIAQLQANSLGGTFPNNIHPIPGGQSPGTPPPSAGDTAPPPRSTADQIGPMSWRNPDGTYVYYTSAGGYSHTPQVGTLSGETKFSSSVADQYGNITTSSGTPGTTSGHPNNGPAVSTPAYKAGPLGNEP